MTGRASGILLHPTCLPGDTSIGDLGRSATRFLDWLESAGQSVWQVLPLGPVGQGFSPYDSGSSFAGNPLLIDLEWLLRRSLLEDSELSTEPTGDTHQIDYSQVERAKSKLLRLAWKRAQAASGASPLREHVQGWALAAPQSAWLEDWTLFKALKSRFDDQEWMSWPVKFRDRHPETLERARQEERAEIEFERFVQFVFFQQLEELRERATARGVSLLGDLPFYVAQDSCDVWTRPAIFDLDDTGHARTVAGVPPDYFSETGQRWGNPIYRWDYLADQGYGWWIDRLQAQLLLVDRLRLDHFRGFVGYWEVPATESTAANGHWRPGPGLPFFEAVRSRIGSLPFVAEDLGLITPDVEELRATLEIPGMRVLQFAFDSSASPHLLHNLHRDVVLYTGTHDNDTGRGWLDQADEELRQRALDYLGATVDTFSWEAVRAVQTSVANLVITPIQDVAGLDGRHRMNTPGTTLGNWQWRLPSGILTAALAARLRRLTELSARCAPRPDNELPAS